MVAIQKSQGKSAHRAIASAANIRALPRRMRMAIGIAANPTDSDVRRIRWRVSGYAASTRAAAVRYTP